MNLSSLAYLLHEGERKRRLREGDGEGEEREEEVTEGKGEGKERGGVGRRQNTKREMVKQIESCLTVLDVGDEKGQLKV